jgi:transposase
LGTDHGTVHPVAEQLGVGSESLRSWVKQAEIDEGVTPGLSTEDAERMKRLEQENRELQRANEILRKASAYFAQAELDRPMEVIVAFIDDHRTNRRSDLMLLGGVVSAWSDLQRTADRLDSELIALSGL